MRKRTLSAWREDAGVAMVTVLGVMLVITVLAIGSYTLARQALHESVRVENETKAFRAASTGMEGVLSTFSESQAAAMAAGEAITGSTPEGSYRITIEDLPDNEWVLTSVGTGLDGTQATVKQRFYFLDLWRMNLSTGSDALMSGSSALNGTSSIVGPFYMKGDLEIQANMAVLEGPLFVKSGNITRKNVNSWLGMKTAPIKVYCDKDIPANVGDGSGKGTGVYVSTKIRRVPDITLPPLSPEKLNEWALTAKNESVDNLMGSTTQLNLESSDGHATSYTTMIPPNTNTWSRKRAQAGSTLPYKFIGPESGVPAAKGAGTTHLVIGGKNSTTASFGAWGSVVTTDGVSLPAGPVGSAGYPVNSWDDFAFNDVTNVLYISGTVYVDGDLTFAEDITYVGNGTIIANGNITLDGDVRPHGTNVQGENNKWALGLVTPKNITFKKGGNNPLAGTGAADREFLRNITPDYAGAFYTEGKAIFTDNNMLVRGTVLARQMEFKGNNITLVTNPLLPDYLPDSLPGAGTGFLSPSLWSRE